MSICIQQRADTASSAASFSNTFDQSPCRVCRNNRMLGYQTVSLLSNNQRQHELNLRTVQTGLPIAPAKCAMLVSALTTRSKCPITAATSSSFMLCGSSPGNTRTGTDDGNPSPC